VFVCRLDQYCFIAVSIDLLIWGELTLLVFSWSSSKNAAALKRDFGISDQPSLPSMHMRQSLSGDVAPPGNLQLIPMIAIGAGAVLSPPGSMVRPEPLTPFVSFVCLMVSQQRRWVGFSGFSVQMVWDPVVIAMTSCFVAGTWTLLDSLGPT
jgi:hypothetical protein